MTHVAMVIKQWAVQIVNSSMMKNKWILFDWAAH